MIEGQGKRTKSISVLLYTGKRLIKVFTWLSAGYALGCRRQTLLMLLWTKTSQSH